jgi:tetratricopeptide (TPR) repeat protein
MLPFLWGATPGYEEALRLYNRTDYEGSLSLLQRIPDKDAQTWGLIGRNLFKLGEYKRAGEAFEKALAADPSNSMYALWLGKSLGRRAESANPLMAPSLASKARRWFERAVELDPRNLEALSDLLEYYLEAPGFLGGGLDKARAVAARMKEIDPAEGANAEARVALKRKEASTAEAHLRRAMELAPRQVTRVLDLATFLARHGRFEESEQLYQQAAKLDPKHPRLLFERAEAYIRAGRNLATARELLEQYLRAPLTPDDPPRQAAEKLLKEAAD